MTHTQYRAIVTSKSYKDFLTVLSDHRPNHPERYTSRIALEIGTEKAPLYLIAHVITRMMPPDPNPLENLTLVELSR